MVSHNDPFLNFHALVGQRYSLNVSSENTGVHIGVEISFNVEPQAKMGPLRPSQFHAEPCGDDAAFAWFLRYRSSRLRLNVKRFGGNELERKPALFN